MPASPPTPAAPPPTAPPAYAFPPADANVYGVQVAMERVEALLATDPLQASRAFADLKVLFAQERARYRDPAILRSHESRMQLLEAKVDVEVSNLSARPELPSAAHSLYPGL